MGLTRFWDSFLFTSLTILSKAEAFLKYQTKTKTVQHLRLFESNSELYWDFSKNVSGDRFITWPRNYYNILPSCHFSFCLPQTRRATKMALLVLLSRLPQIYSPSLSWWFLPTPNSSCTSYCLPHPTPATFFPFKVQSCLSQSSSYSLAIYLLPWSI